MRLSRAIGILVVSALDALVPAAFVAVVVFFLVTEPIVDVSRPGVVTLTAAGVTFAVTITYGLASVAFRNRPFPVTRAAKRVADWWLLYGWP